MNIARSPPTLNGLGPIFVAIGKCVKCSYGLKVKIYLAT